ncbi:MAG: hypothetical protein SWH61_05125 [Thermodesulfobacteriota bacterium]|nr:hypothetical protein [Thermodesulfobacteriota bacterium]
MKRKKVFCVLSIALLISTAIFSQGFAGEFKVYDANDNFIGISTRPASFVNLFSTSMIHQSSSFEVFLPDLNMNVVLVPSATQPDAPLVTRYTIGHGVCSKSMLQEFFIYLDAADNKYHHNHPYIIDGCDGIFYKTENSPQFVGVASGVSLLPVGGTLTYRADCDTVSFGEVAPLDIPLYPLTEILASELPFDLPIAGPLEIRYTGGGVAKPHTFVPNTPAKADEVNANFDALYDYLNQ